MGIKLYVVRHGQTQHNVAGIIQGHTDSPLTALGKSQARRTAKRLEEIRFDAIYTSDLGRAVATARIIAKKQNCEIIKTENLRESYMGEVQGLTRDLFEAKYPGAYERWISDSVHNRPPGAESIDDIIARCKAFTDKLVAEYPDDSKILAVTHGGPTRGLICAVLGMPREYFVKFRCYNAGITLLHVDPRPSMSMFNDVSHLRRSATTRFDADSLQFSR